MKKLIIIFVIFGFANTWAQNINQYQYWYDNNYASNTLVNINSTSLLDLNTGLSGISGLVPGIHELNFRARNNQGKRSVVMKELFIVPSNLVIYEYWFDDDYTNRVTQPFASTQTYILLSNLNCSSIGYGMHKLNFRSVDSAGKWSVVLSQYFVKKPKLTNAEYWIDNDFANKQAVSFTATEEVFINQNFLMTGINDDDLHTFNFRTQDEGGKWSVVSSSYFMRKSQIVGYEYWFNNNYTQKVAVAVTPTDIMTFAPTFDTQVLPVGNHVVHFRAKNNLGKYSSTISNNFCKSTGNNNFGVTVLVHGFQAGGGTLDTTSDFFKMAVAIVNRAGGGVIYKNNNLTGQIELMQGGYNLDYSKEIVLVYDWQDLSNNNVVGIDFGGNGYLESAADNLLATFLKLGNHLYPASSNPIDQFMQKPKHLIAHSRGNIVTIQFLHRLKTYFPNVTVDQFTLLDPHPATSFGDMTCSIPSAPPNLPGVIGTAENCVLPFGCVNSGVFLKIPENVVRADNYYRRDNTYESITDFGSFDGVPVPDLGAYNRELNNGVIDSGSPLLGGAHSAVHLWYRGTINTNEVVAGNTGGYFVPNPLGGLPIYVPITVTAQENNDNWYVNGSMNTANNFLQTENRMSTGYNQSRAGGCSQIPVLTPDQKISLTAMNQQMALRYGLSLNDYPDGVPPHSVNGGYFDNSNAAGWEKNGGSNTITMISNGTAKVDHSAPLKHSMMYFGNLAFDFKFLKFNVQKFYSTNLQGDLKIEFFNSLGEVIESQTISASNINATWKTIYVAIPNQLRATAQNPNGAVGTFAISKTVNDTNFFNLDEFTLVSCTPITTNLLVTMPDPSTLNFMDVQNDDWFKEGVYKSRNYGLFRGTSTTTFSPDNNLTKAQAVTVLVRAGIKLGLISGYNTTGTAYTDVEACNQYFPYIQTAKNLGYLNMGTTFNPEANITVAELCVFMDKILQINLHDWNATSNPWVMAPTAAYVFSQMSQINITQTDPVKQAAMRRILNCIDVVKNDNAIESYRTQNVWTLKDVESITTSNGLPINVDGSATVTRARMAVAAANLYRFVYKKLNNGSTPLGRMANQTNSTTNDPSIDNFIGIGNTFDNKDIPATDTPEAPTQLTFNINSGDTLGLQYQSDTDTAGNPQFFYWSMNKNVDSNIANLVSVPINSIQNHRKVNFVAPVVTSPKTWYLYSYLANNKGKIKETVITINVSSTLSTGEVDGILDNVKIYPNPTDNILFIDTIDNQIQKIEIFDLQGRLLKTIKENKEKYQIDISTFSSATYLFKLSTEKGNQTVKIVKK